jgi:hypothetical protein
MAKFQRSDIDGHVRSILRERTRPARRRVALQLTRDLLSATCTDPKYAMKRLLKLWTKLGGLR